MHATYARPHTARQMAQPLVRSARQTRVTGSIPGAVGGYRAVGTLHHLVTGAFKMSVNNQDRYVKTCVRCQRKNVQHPSSRICDDCLDECRRDAGVRAQVTNAITQAARDER